MFSRRTAIRLLGALPAASWTANAHPETAPALAPGAPNSPERTALIDAFKAKIDGLPAQFEKRTHRGAWAMPYRLFRPSASAKLPLIVYLHGSGGLGDDNEKQLALGNIFGTRVWLLAGNQKAFPCYVLAPQTDRGWVRYDPEKWKKDVAEIVPGLGEGARLALEIVDALRHEFPIDDRRIYVMGQSMGGGGTWNVLTYRPRFFAAAVVCCGSSTADDGTGSIETPVWSFHGDADQTVPVSVSRERMAARRKAGGQPLYTEYAGVDHNVWQWAFTEPDLPKWLFAQRRA